MNGNLVKNITLPDDSILTSENIRKDAKEMLTDTADKSTVEFVIDNIQEAVKAAHQDFCCNDRKFFEFKDPDDGQTKYIIFSLSGFRHLFGIAPRPQHKGEQWKEAQIIQTILQDQKLCQRLNNKLWIDQLAEILTNYKQQIIEHDCSKQNEGKPKLNWEKIAVKIFGFINIGNLKEGITYLYKESRNKNSKGSPRILLIRSLRNAELEDGITYSTAHYYDKQLVIELVEEEYDGKICLTPSSIRIISKPLKRTDPTKRERMGNVTISELDGNRRKNNEPLFLFKGPVKITKKFGIDFINSGISKAEKYILIRQGSPRQRIPSPKTKARNPGNKK